MKSKKDNKKIYKIEGNTTVKSDFKYLKKMKILFITYGCMYHKMIEIFADFADELIILTSKRFKKDFDVEYKKVNRGSNKINVIYANSIFDYIKKCYKLRKNGINIIVSNCPISSFVGHISKFFYNLTSNHKCNSINIMCSDFIEYYKNGLTNKLDKLIKTTILNILMKISYHNSTVLTLSNYLKGVANKYSPKRIGVIPIYGVDTKHFVPMKQDLKLKNELGLKGKFVVGCVARLSPEKGIEYLLKSIKGLKHTIKNLHVVILGAGCDDERIKKMANNLEVNDTVSFLDWVPRKSLPRYFSIMDVVVHTSLIEGLGFALIEALACEKFVVATNVGGIPDYLIHKKTGVLIKPKSSKEIEDAVIWGLNNKKSTQKMGKNGRKLAIKKFDEKVVLKKFIKFIGLE